MFDLLIGLWCQFYIIDSPVCSAKFIKWQTHLILKFERVCDIQFSKQQTGLLNKILKIYRLFCLVQIRLWLPFMKYILQTSLSFWNTYLTDWSVESIDFIFKSASIDEAVILGNLRWQTNLLAINFCKLQYNLIRLSVLKNWVGRPVCDLYNSFDRLFYTRKVN